MSIPPSEAIVALCNLGVAILTYLRVQNNRKASKAEHEETRGQVAAASAAADKAYKEANDVNVKIAKMTRGQ